MQISLPDFDGEASLKSAAQLLEKWISSLADYRRAV